MLFYEVKVLMVLKNFENGSDSIGSEIEETVQVLL